MRNAVSLSLVARTGGGELAELVECYDWAGSPLGPKSSWDQSLRTAVDILLSSRYAMWMAWGPEQIFLYNDAYAPTLGVKHPWALGKPSSEVWAEIWPDIGPRIDRVLATGEATWDEALLLFLRRSAYDEETYHTFSYSPLRDDRGGIAGHLCVVAEETARVIADRRLRTLGRLSAGLAEATTEAAIISATAAALAANPEDLPFALLYLTEAGDGRDHLVQSTGFAPGGGPPAIVDPAEAVGPWHGLLGHEGAAPIDLAALRLPGGALPCGAWRIPPQTALSLAIAAPVNGRQAGRLIVGLNPHRRLDPAYTEFLGLLAGQIASGLAGARAYEAERRRAAALLELDRAKTTFFNNISHEFRTPLTLMLGPLGEALALPAEAPAAAARPMLSLALRNAERLLLLVNRLLDFARMDAGAASSMERRAVDIANLTREIAETFRPTMERAGLAYSVRCDAIDRPLLVDGHLWERLVLNLLSNAFKFTLRGGVELRLALDRAVLRLEVRDTGIGIEPAHLPRIFERFHRIEGATGRSHEGSGIGLALVREIARLHGGEARVESVPGSGTCFTVELPAERPAGDDIAPLTAAHARLADAFVQEAEAWLPDPVAAGPAAAPSAATGARVLVVDDNADMRRYVGALLRQAGYEVVSAVDGNDALARLAEAASPPDLVLADVMMPGLDGLGLLRAIRENATLRDRPVILLSARADEPAQVAGLDLGADDYLAKPFMPRELLARVQANIGMARLRRQAVEAAEAMNATLEARVEARSAALAETEAQLRQSQKMQAVGQLTGGIAHDFNNMLQGISGGLEMMTRRMRQGRLAEAEAFGEEALRAVDRAAALTSRLLTFSRRQSLDPKPIDTGHLIGELHTMLQRTMGARIGIELVLGAEDRVSCDANQLENALLNLCINARDAMQDGGRLRLETLTVELDAAALAGEPDLAPGRFVAIRVTDTGCGMTPETLRQAFEPFFTTKPIGQGTGLGLSQVYGFLKQSGGTVQLQSAPGRGTTVTLLLPATTRDTLPA